jgi:hypothetical protein
MNQNENKEIWRECLDFEASRDPRAFHQTLSLEGNWCVNCGFHNQPQFKKETQMNETEKMLWEKLKIYRGRTPQPEQRKFRLTKSDIGIWCYVCEKCVSMMPKDWE